MRGVAALPSSSAAGATTLPVIASSFHTVANEALNLGEAAAPWFPYILIDEVRQDAIEFVAIAHTSREAGYWLKRTPAAR